LWRRWSHAIERGLSAVAPVSLSVSSTEEDVTMPETKPRVLFVCTHNAARSQMAEALLRHYAGERFEVLSAGKAPTEVHPLTRQVLTDIGLDTRELQAKSLDLFFAKVSITYAIIVCDQAEDDCPRLYPFALNTFYWPFDDPTQTEGSAEVRLRTFRRVLDQIDRRVRDWLETLEGV
jgi:arsenate reductase